MKRLFLIATLIMGCGIAPSQAASSGHYLTEGRLPLQELLSNPPTDESPEIKREFETLIHEQERRTPADIERVKSEAILSAANFAAIIGPKFTAENLPLTFALIQKVDADAREASEEAKTIWNRRRPPLQNKAIVPGIEPPKTSSYPSGHATRGHLYAMVLGEIFRDKRGPLLARGWLIGWDRVMAGVHFPSDIAAGLKLGDYLAERLFASPAFQEDLGKAREECQRVLEKP